MPTISSKRNLDDKDDESIITEQLNVPIAKRKAIRKVTIPLIKQMTSCELESNVNVDESIENVDSNENKDELNENKKDKFNEKKDELNENKDESNENKDESNEKKDESSKTVALIEIVGDSKKDIKITETLSQIKRNSKKKTSQVSEKSTVKVKKKNKKTSKVSGKSTVKVNEKKKRKRTKKAANNRKRRKMTKKEEKLAEDKIESNSEVKIEKTSKKKFTKKQELEESKTDNEVHVEKPSKKKKSKKKRSKKQNPKTSKKASKKKPEKKVNKKFVSLSSKIVEELEKKDQTDALSDVIIFDFETTGLSPQRGHRSIEIGAVLLQNGKITAKFQELMNPGQRIPRFIEKYTGITNEMIKTADTNKNVMTRFHEFIGNYNLVAHNASFDQKFLIAEFNLVGLEFQNNVACTLLNCRRFYFNSPNYKLGTLIDHLNIKQTGDFHRALADSEMTAYLWIKMIADMKKRYGISFLSFSMVKNLRSVPKKKVDEYWNSLKC